MNYYNDNDPFCCAWLKELIAEGLLPEGEVDDRSITEVESADLKGFTQCHFFCGIGGWPYAASLAGCSEVPLWTGSCPCQPLSCAGKRKGEKDERHLWPEFYRIISECAPPVVFGEQVSSKDGLEWLDGISLDLEELGYAVGALDLPAASVGAPHIRQRLFWVADAKHKQNHKKQQEPAEIKRRRHAERSCGCGVDCWLADTKDTDRRGLRKNNTGRGTPKVGRSGGAFNFWPNSILIPCADGKARRIPGRWVEDAEQSNNRGQEQCQEVEREKTVRPAGGPRGSSSVDNTLKSGLEIEPTLFPLAHGLPNRVGILRGAGNAIVPQVAAEFIKAFMSLRPGQHERTR